MRNRFVTLKEIAEKLNLSVSSVSRALQDHHSISQGTRLKVKKLSEQLGYIPNLPAVSLQNGQTKTIGIVIPRLIEPFFAAAFSAIEKSVRQKNYKVIIGQSDDSESKEKKIVEDMLHNRVEGMLISLGKSTTEYSHLNLLKENRIPTVFFDCIPNVENIHYVVCDIIGGTIEAMNYLLSQGHRVIGLINGPKSLSASKEREEGYKRALSMSRLKIDPGLIVSCSLSEHDTREAMEKLLNGKRRPTAIMIFNDSVAVYAINYLQRSHYPKSWKDIEFISYANMPLLKYMDFGPSASIEQFPHKQGEKATEILFNLIRQKRYASTESNAFFKVYIEPQLVQKTQ